MRMWAVFLGGVRTELTNQDLNDLITIGVYFTNGVDSVLHKPVDTAYNNLIEIERQRGDNSTRIMQRFYSFNDKCLWIRQKNELGWDVWKQSSFDIPSFYKSYTDLSSLASALGDGSKWNINFVGDLNDFTTPLPATVLYNPDLSKIQNVPPFSAKTSFFIRVGVSHTSNDAAGLRILQEVFDIEHDAMYFRVRKINTWGDWKKVTTT